MKKDFLMIKIKRIGILTGGGDCPGLNAVIRAVTKTAMYDHGMEVYGIEDGWKGLIENKIKKLEDEDVSSILTVGGTILGSCNRSNAEQHVTYDDQGNRSVSDVTDRCLKHIAEHGLDALVVIGGDGTMSGAANFVKHGVNCIGVPKTIDNDLMQTDVTFGHATAVMVATEALDRVHSTAASHHRAMIVEVMGRNAGWIALHAGIASGSDVILLPEIPYDIAKICEHVTKRSKHRKRYTVLCVSEGARAVGGGQVVAGHDKDMPDPVRLGGVGNVIALEIEANTGIQARTTVLGYTQRGGTPVAEDRLLATKFGHAAVRLLKAGERNRLVVMQGGKVRDVDILSVVNQQRMVPLDNELILAGRSLDTCFGD